MFQPINLGTPNNNDGDSLYAGGSKINLNFTEIYTALAGDSSTALKIAIGTTTSNPNKILSWSTSSNKFVPSSSDAIRTTGASGQNSLFITNSSGAAGNADQDLAGTASDANSLINILQNSRMFTLNSRSGGLGIRGALDINLGNNNVTSLSVYTTGTVVRGVNGLTITLAGSEDGAITNTIMNSTSTGLQFFLTPRIDLTSVTANVRTGSDSSNAIAHTGFVKLNLGVKANSSIQITARRGIVSNSPTADLTGNMAFNIDGIYHPKHMEGLIYNYNTSNNIVTLVTGAAAHWSYSTSGVAGVDQTSAIAIVASYTPILRKFQTGWTPEYKDDGTIGAVIDSTTYADTWYYLYYLGCLQQHTVGTKTFYPGSSNVLISSNRSIADVQNQIDLSTTGGAGNWAVVRRIGPIKTAPDHTVGSPKILPFNVKRIDHGAFEFYWGLNAGAWASGAGLSSSSYTTSISAAANLLIVSSSDATLQLSRYVSATLVSVPPIPGVTAFLTVKHTPSGAASAAPYVYLYGNAWTVNQSISTLYPPFEFFRSMTSGAANVHNIQLPMSPDGCYIPDGTYGGAGILSVMGNTGQTVRYIMQAGEAGLLVTSTNLTFTVTGFRYAR